VPPTKKQRRGEQKMELLSKTSKATHKILILSLCGEDKGKSKSVTISAPEASKEAVMEQVIKTILNGGN
jgi:hypothetical protein